MQTKVMCKKCFPDAIQSFEMLSAATLCLRVINTRTDQHLSFLPFKNTLKFLFQSLMYYQFSVVGISTCV